MSQRGVLIGRGYVKNKGQVEVYQDLDKTTFLHCLTKRGEWIFVNRNRVRITERANNGSQES